MANEKGTRYRWIAHVDMDSFYVSVERLKNPKLVGRPVVVGGLGPRAVVSSSSYEARKFGVRSAMPMAQARRLCAQLVVVPPDFASYSKLSHMVFSALESIAPVVEQVSVDEAYLDFTGCERLYKSWDESALRVKENVKEVAGLTCTVGVSSNKLISKIASDHAKPDGLLIVPPGTEAAFLGPLSIRKIPGLGPKTSILFESKGIMTCEDLVRFNSSTLKSYFGDHALDFQEKAKGLDDSTVHSEGERKSLSVEETFDVDVGDLAELEEEIRQMSEELGTSLRQENLMARTVQIKIRYENFTTCVRAVTLSQPTSMAKEVATAAIQLLKTNKEKGRKLRLLGISLRNFVSDGVAMSRQFDLFESPERRLKAEKVEKVKDELKRKFGTKILR